MAELTTALVGVGGTLEALATAALEDALALPSAVDRADLNAGADACRASVERFVRAARRQLDLPGVATGPPSGAA